MQRNLIVILFILSSAICIYSQSAQSKKSEISFTSKELVNSELLLSKRNLGKVYIEVDSNKRLESQPTINSTYEHSISFKFIKNIGFGSTIKLKEEAVLSPELNSHIFHGFRASDNANFAISKIDIEDNLLSNDISIIFLDSKEKLWIGYKNEGFSCLTTNKITHYNDLVQFSSIEVTSITEYNQHIWIGTKNSGLLKVSDDGSIKKYNIKNGLPSNQISDFCIDANNYLWISTFDAGIFRVDNGTFYNYSKLHSGISLNISKIEFNKTDNKIWLYDENNNILNIDNSYNLNIVNYDDINLSKEIQDFECDTKVNILYKDNWIGSISEDNIEISQLSQKSDETLFSSIFTARSGNIWIGGKTGDLMIKFPSFTSTIHSQNGLSNTIISGVIQDQFDQVWVSTLGEGIFQISKSNFKTLINGNDNYFSASTSLASDTSQLIFQGKNGIVSADNNFNLTFYNHPQLKESNCIFVKDSSIYIASNTGFYVLKNDSLYQYTHPLKSQQTYNRNLFVAEGADKNSILITNNRYGLYKFKLADESFEILGISQQSKIKGTYKDPLNRIWIANHSGKIQFIKDDKLFQSEFTIQSIRDYKQDQYGKLWIITKKGAYYLNKDLNEIVKITVNSPTVSNDLRSIEINDKGSILIGTQKNLLKIDALPPHYYQAYTKDFGINGSSYSYNGICTFKDAIYFSTNKGIIKYTDFEFTKTYTLNISLSNIKINGFDYNGTVAKDENLVHSYEKNKLTISQNFESFEVQLLTNYWGNRDNLIYYYRQDKRDSWKGPIPNGVFIFNSLKDNLNSLEFKAVSFGGVTSNILTIDIVVKVPFYRQRWFNILLISLIFLSIVYLFKDKLSFNFKSLHSYSNLSTFLYKTRILSALLLILLPSFEYLFGYRLEFYTPEYLFLSLLLFLVLMMLLFSFSKRVSFQNLINITTINSIIILYFICFRSFNSNFNFLFTIESMTIIAFVVFIMEDIKRYLIFLFFTSVIVLYGFKDFDTSNIYQVMFLVGNILLISFTILYQIFKSSRTNHLIFSENVINTYDKLILVYNVEGEVVYFNDPIKTFFNCGDEELLGYNWYRIRGVSPSEQSRIQQSIADQIRSKQVEDSIEEELFSTATMSYESIKWEFQNLDSQYLMAIGSNITIEKTQEKEIIQLSQIAELVFNGVTRNDANGNVLWCNSGFEAITGYSFEELKGKRFSQVIKTPDFFKAEYNHILNKETDFNKPFTVAHYKKTGELIYLMIIITPIYENGEIQEYIEVITDITEQKIKEKDFKRLSLIAQHTQNPTLLISTDFQLLWYNGAFIKEFGFAEEYLNANYIKRLLKGASKDDSQFNQFQKKINKGKKATGEFLIYNILQDLVWMQISMDPIYNDAGEVVEYICIMQNIQKIKDTQRLLVEKNKNVSDSISYALRIQNALLPNLKLLKKTLPPNFMYYQPKDIVSGDFYFVEMQGSKLFIAVADCTGHGVPGAMMTSIGSAALNNAILEKKLSDTGVILEFVDLYLKNSLSTNADELSDGMDIGLIALDFKTETLEYCGAKRPLILISEEGIMSKIEGIKKSIGEFSFGDQFKYVSQSIKIDKLLNIYCFSDGIPDQFGGARKKKLYLRKVLDHLQDHSALPLDEQKSKLIGKMNEWTGEFQETEQTDDMVLFGARITPAYMAKMRRIFSIDS